MSTHSTTDADANPGDMTDVTISPTAMHRPGHCPLDNAEIAATDEVMHDMALRDSVLRTPR
jgi:hypothetical protein